MGMMILAIMGVFAAVAGMSRETEQIEVIDATPKQLRRYNRLMRRRMRKDWKIYGETIRKHERIN